MSTWQAHTDHSATSPRSSLPASKSLDSDAIPRMSHSPTPSAELRSMVNNDLLRKNPDIITSEAALSPSIDQSETETSKISAYARLDFENYTFFVQTLQVVLGRKAGEDGGPSHHAVDVHLSSKKAISRRHAKIFYNFGTQRFEISILGRNGAFVDDQFVETGITVPLADNTKIQIGDIPFTFVLPSLEPIEKKSSTPAKPFNPSDAINLRSNLYSNPGSPNRKKSLTEEQKKARRNSRADIVRRLSNARRKSLASSTNDEITALLKELEDIGDDDESDPFDKEVNELLRSGNLEKEEDELDELVKQHNLSQGIGIEEKDKKDVDVDMSVLDQEIASLAPLIDGQQPDKDALDVKQGGYGRHGTTLSTDAADHKSAPLMGRPAGPRMGKPAQIQPPANRAYGRQPLGSMYGYPNSGTYPQGYSSPYGSPAGYPAGARNSIYHPMMPTRPPPPKLEVEVETINTVIVKTTTLPFKAITTSVGNIQRPAVCVFKALDPPSTKPKIPLKRKDAPSIKRPKSQGNKDVPEQYKSKPTVSVTAMVSNVLRGPNSRKSGFTFGEICDGIKEFYPYYQYCPDGWQSMITHNLKTHKMFKREFKGALDSEHLWVIDDDFLAEKERVRKKQQEVAMAKAKEAALKAVELRSKQSPPQYGSVGRPFMTPYASSFGQPRYPTSRDSSPPANNGAPGQKPKSIAELASEIKRDSPATLNQSSYLQRSSLSPSVSTTEQNNSIKDQLATNRSTSSSSTNIASDVKPERGSPTPQPVAAAAAAVSATTNSGSVSKSLPMNADTKKSLGYLQKELFTLYKARKLSYNTATTTNIITKALATTIAQVNTIGAKAGCGDNALSFLVEKAPQQVSKILDIALTKSIKEIEGKSSNPTSKESTPAPSTLPVSTGAVQKPLEDGRAVSRPSTPNSPAGGTPKPSYSGGLSRPHFSGMSRQQNPSKPGALSKGPSFLSNKPRQEKRPAEETGEDPSKSIKLE